MHLLTVVVSRDRLPFLKETIATFQETCTMPYDLVIVDNASEPETREWIVRSGITAILLPRNLYPGAACNLGFGLRSPKTTHLHRSDNDMRFLPGWADRVLTVFEQNKNVVQVSLRTNEQEPATDAVGGNMVVSRSVFDDGIRYTDEPWDSVPWEDGLLTQHIVESGGLWARVGAVSTIHLGDPPDFSDTYYRETYTIRGLEVPADER